MRLTLRDLRNLISEEVSRLTEGYTPSKIISNLKMRPEPLGGIPSALADEGFDWSDDDACRKLRGPMWVCMAIEELDDAGREELRSHPKFQPQAKASPSSDQSGALRMPENRNRRRY